MSEILDRANDELKYFKKKSPWEVYFPPPSLCTDNGVMVAWTGIELFQSGISHDLLQDLEPLSRWRIGNPLPDTNKKFRKRSHLRQNILFSLQFDANVVKDFQKFFHKK